MSGLTEKAKALIELHNELASSDTERWVKRVELQRLADDRSVATDKTVRKWCQRLTALGAWEARQVDGRWQHRTLRDMGTEPIGLPTPEELASVVVGGRSEGTRHTPSGYAASEPAGRPGSLVPDGSDCGDRDTEVSLAVGRDSKPNPLPPAEVGIGTTSITNPAQSSATPADSPGTLANTTQYRPPQPANCEALELFATEARPTEGMQEAAALDSESHTQPADREVFRI